MSNFVLKQLYLLINAQNHCDLMSILPWAETPNSLLFEYLVDNIERPDKGSSTYYPVTKGNFKLFLSL